MLYYHFEQSGVAYLFLFEHVAHDDSPVLRCRLFHAWETGHIDGGQWDAQRLFFAKVQAETLNLTPAHNAGKRIGPDPDTFVRP